MKRPLWMGALGWASGIGLAQELPVGWQHWSVVALLFSGCVGAAFVQRWRWRIVTLLVWGCLAGAAHFAWVDEGNRTRLPVGPPGESGSFTVTGTVTASPVVDGDRLRMEVRLISVGNRRISGEKILLRVKLRNEEEKTVAMRLHRGMTVHAAVRMKRPEPARNPGAFDHRRYLYRKQIHWVAEAGSMQDLHLLPGSGGGLFTYTDEVRRFLGQRLEAVYPAPVVGLVRGMLLGEREAVPGQVEADFTRLGLVHLLAISGLHVGVVAGCIYGALTLSGWTREKAAGACILFLPFYALLTGAGAPVIRASIMAGLALLAVILRRWRDGLSFLGAAAWVMLLWNPYQLFEAGFQLSFLVTLALLTAVEPLGRMLPFPWKRVNQLTAVTMVAQTASFPVIITHFHEFSLLSWGANWLLVPVFSLCVIPLCFVTLLLTLVHPGAAVIPAKLSEWLLTGCLEVTEYLARWMVFHLSWAPPPAWWLAAYGAGCLYLLAAWAGSFHRKGRHRLFSLITMAGLIWMAFEPGMWKEKELRITFLDVGQGDAAVMETPSGKVILVDGGGAVPFDREPWQIPRKTFDVGEDVVVPHLRYRGIRRIDYLIITHGDADHIGGLRAVVEHIPVDRVIRNPLPAKGPMEQELMDALRRTGARVTTAEPGTSWELEPGISWQFLHPPAVTKAGPKHSGSEEGTNDDSVVFLLTAFGRNVLMTGDIEREGEQAILRSWRLPEADLLKVAHHGSNTSTGEDWLNAVRPKSSVISVGKDNRFGHPAPDVLERLAQRGIPVFRTDLHGAVTVRISPGKWRVETMLP